MAGWYPFGTFQRLLGHSDADVLCIRFAMPFWERPICDIGYHFRMPEKFKNIDSKIAFEKELGWFTTKDIKVGISMQLFAPERPKLKAHIPLMQETMGNRYGRYPIKATTARRNSVLPGGQEGIPLMLRVAREGQSRLLTLKQINSIVRTF